MAHAKKPDAPKHPQHAQPKGRDALGKRGKAISTKKDAPEETKVARPTGEIHARNRMHDAMRRAGCGEPEADPS